MKGPRAQQAADPGSNGSRSDNRSERFFLPHRLYGRDREIEELSGRIASSADGRASVTLVTGYSGIGKSALVGETLGPVTERLGYFAEGKADLYARDAPYHVLLRAATAFLEQVLAEPEQGVARWRHSMSGALAHNAGALFDVLPSLELLLGAQPRPEALEPVQARNRFLRALMLFFQTAARSAPPFVLFLDDLQWADAGTLELLTLLVGDPDTRGLVLLGAYRDNEVGPDHPLRAARSRWASEGVSVAEVRLRPLPEEALRQWLSDTVGTEGGDFDGLVALVGRKTEGNPFFVRSFLNALHQEGLVAHDPQRARWTWDVAALAQAAATDTVAEHMAARLGRLSGDARHALSVAAALGARFSADVVARCLEVPTEDATRLLWAAAEQGFLLPLGGRPGDAGAPAAHDDHDAAAFRFAHDRVQEAAYALLPEEARPALHLELARLLAEDLREDSAPERVFDAAGHFHRSGDLLEDPEERIRVAHLEAQAAEQATASGAHQAALSFLERALEKLGEDPWTEQYDLALRVHHGLCRLYALAGLPERSEEVGEATLANARSVLDKLPIFTHRVLRRTASMDLLGAVDEAVVAARLAGCEIEPLAGPDEAPTRFAKLVATIGAPIPSELVHPKAAADLTQASTQCILASATPAAAMAESPYYLPMLFALVRHVVEHGATEMAATVAPQYAVFLRLSDLREESYEVGKLARVFRERFGSQGGYLEHNVFVRHWREPLVACLEELREGAARCLDAGDLASWGYCLNQAFEDAFLCGENLDRLDARYDADWRALTRYELLPARGSLEIWGQAVACLRGDAPDSSLLRGDRLDVDAAIVDLSEARVGLLVQYCTLLQIMLAYLFGESARAVEWGQVRRKVAESGIQALSIAHPLRLWFRSLAVLDLPAGRREELYVDLLADHSALRRFASECPENHAHRLALLEAELARVEDRPADAVDAYDESVRLAEAHSFPQDAALANERAGLFHHAADRGVGLRYLERAAEGYRRWGARAKVADLAARFPELSAR